MIEEVRAFQIRRPGGAREAARKNTGRPRERPPRDVGPAADCERYISQLNFRTLGVAVQVSVPAPSLLPGVPRGVLPLSGPAVPSTAAPKYESSALPPKSRVTLLVLAAESARAPRLMARAWGEVSGPVRV